MVIIWLCAPRGKCVTQKPYEDFARGPPFSLGACEGAWGHKAMPGLKDHRPVSLKE